jgi:serine protease
MGNWNLSWHHKCLHIADLWDRKITGAGVTVAVLDTGLAQPQGLAQDSFEYLDARGRPVSPYDPDGHGTCCASVIASRKGGALGIAPEAKIVSFRVLQTGNEAEDIETALVYILQNRSDINVVSCSFIVSAVSDALRAVVRNLANAGTVVVAAAGDDSGQSPEFPELTQNAITVAATDQHAQPLGGAVVGPWIDLAAPGNDIPALAPQIGRVILFGQSSAAAAVASGVAALTLSTRPAGPSRQNLGVGLEGLLKTTATSDPTVDPNAIGAGIVNPIALVKAAEAIP